MEVLERGNMATKKKTSTDAIALLKADHKKVRALLETLDKTKASARRVKLIGQIEIELKAHAKIEEEIFYPAAKDALNDKEMVPEALVEHDGVKKLIAEIENSEGGEMFDARVKVLSELVKHHVKEEQGELFPAVKKTDLDLTELGAQLAARKAELLDEFKIPA